ncbi:penicillin-binding protein 2 [Anaerospora sp.]|jgi:penicillin-binding protein 2|uniref:penicillin-binding protein 2 n=1 Tax=Anaerospora sp. TaxID=1960278 RepID=UPI0028992F2F|nr:penicillin-binding protein 2 [Anaerospora sp.]MDF2928242.1 mrdA 1 [Anaerospora sp.]
MLAKRVNQRFDVLGLIVFIVFVALVSRLGYLQVVQGKYYERLADGNRIRLIPIMAPRGVFYDRNGVALVSNRPGFTVSLVPISGPIPDDVIRKLAAILAMNETDIRTKIQQNNGAFEPIRIKTDIGPDIVTKIEERRSELPGVAIEIQPIRNYVNNELAAHAFGYVSEINDVELEKRKSEGYKQGDIIGKFGLERVYDKELRGIDGGGQVEVDVTGRPVQELGKKEPIPGSSLTLTVDYRIQKAAEAAIDEQLKYLQTKTEFVNAKAAAAIAMNPQTGEILAMVSRPTFNPNLFAVGISTKDWKLINENPSHPMDNKVISGEYPPGSTFKIVTGTAALELGKVTPEEKILDTGTHWIIPKGNAGGEALGWINFREALAKSDNVYFYEMGNRLGIDNLEKYARAFGLGTYTGINLPGESNGLVANRRYKEKVYEEDWYLSETFDAAIGQGFQLATPLQIAVMLGEIANGGHRYRPYLVSKITAPDGSVTKTFAPEEVGKIDISSKTLNLVRDSLREVAQEGGTAGDSFRGFPISIAGKTGTAENSHGDDHGWFVAYGPYEDPRIVVVVIVEQGGYGASSAVPIAKKILEAAFNINQQQTEASRVYKTQTAL